ncbi:hypothetical protein [Vibrio sp. LaRot3]|uniref:hypothetical protein n=1 Tax=Vibrio sp. LaRot3 TaxID=2998829 RepID=UPI0022CDF9DA|nr:hypothetical protein [Vibrio sp. LaRot3]MDA0150462.1 hypothetical protein [Vibrio sp. LaRot3]
MTKENINSCYSIYNSKKIMKQQPKMNSSFLQRLLTKGQKFDFSIANSNIPISFIEDFKPSDISSKSKNNEKKTFWDEEKLYNESLSPLSQLYFIIVALVKVSLIFFIPLFYLLSLTAAVVDNSIDSQVEQLTNITIYWFIPCILYYTHYKMLNRGYFFLAPFLKSRLNFTLNRKTGMVTLYKKRNEVQFSHPFIEFDCVLMSAPTPQGHLNYSLMLVHRYHEYSTGVPLHNFVGSNQLVSEYALVWNMIQRYMDTSQPMPDVLALEQSRDKDPVTAAHDKKTNRPPRYWRDMTDEQFAETVEKMREKQKTIPATGPTINIFAETPSHT